jgi:hypothetical protein
MSCATFWRFIFYKLMVTLLARSNALRTGLRSYGPRHFRIHSPHSGYTHVHNRSCAQSFSFIMVEDTLCMYSFYWIMSFFIYLSTLFWIPETSWSHENWQSALVGHFSLCTSIYCLRFFAWELEVSVGNFFASFEG